MSAWTAVLFCTFISTAHADDDFSYTPNDYVQKHAALAAFESLRSNIPASIIMAQAIFESNWGESDLARRSNNHFGVKASNWDGQVEYAKDDDRDKNGRLVSSKFRKYETVQQSYMDHTDFLRSNDRYGVLFSYDRTDYKDWAIGLARCGYATQAGYAQKLIKLIEFYELYKLDVPQALSTTEMQTPVFNVIENKPVINHSRLRPNQSESHMEDGTLFEIIPNNAVRSASGQPLTPKDSKNVPQTTRASQNEFYEFETKTRYTAKCNS